MGNSNGTMRDIAEGYQYSAATRRPNTVSSAEDEQLNDVLIVDSWASNSVVSVCIQLNTKGTWLYLLLSVLMLTVAMIHAETR